MFSNIENDFKDITPEQLEEYIEVYIQIQFISRLKFDIEEYIDCVGSKIELANFILSNELTFLSNVVQTKHFLMHILFSRKSEMWGWITPAIHEGVREYFLMDNAKEFYVKYFQIKEI